MRPLYIGYAIFIIFQIPVAVAQNLETLMLARLLLGFFGTSALAIIPGALEDFWGPVERAIAISLFSAATFVGPIFGPIVYVNIIIPRINRTGLELICTQPVVASLWNHIWVGDGLPGSP